MVLIKRFDDIEIFVKNAPSAFEEFLFNVKEDECVFTHNIKLGMPSGKEIEGEVSKIRIPLFEFEYMVERINAKSGFLDWEGSKMKLLHESFSAYDIVFKLDGHVVKCISGYNVKDKRYKELIKIIKREVIKHI